LPLSLFISLFAGGRSKKIIKVFRNFIDIGRLFTQSWTIPTRLVQRPVVPLISGGLTAQRAAKYIFAVSVTYAMQSDLSELIESNQLPTIKVRPSMSDNF
jgi:hypothetical protein